ncbi:type II secretion system F family protein [Clostridium thermobutyricum]|uniref:Type II secretion system protein F n=1 Tax=Clostridium thermobutyricum DSM 4928 TaxID=1121339 RepID=A0A1V4SZ06_9CLOT|nr:type II secretion system F family protein [Clostridium thermobutyricum]OPX50860.1 type II secretion system protein F [Clostridium thermobutyricum DSM 4928]
MAIYKYKAKNMQGDVIEGSLEVASKELLMENIRSKGYFPIKIEIEKGNDLEIDLFKKKINLKELSILARQLGFLMRSGVSITKSLEIAHDQSQNKRMKEILAKCSEEVNKGRSLSECLSDEKDFPKLMINLIKAGEISGRLDTVMLELSEYYKKLYKQKQKISQATIYPKILVGFSILVVTFLLAFVVPEFVNNLISGVGEIPVVTKALVVIGDFIKNNIIYISGFVVGIVLAKKFVLDKNENFRIFMGKLVITAKGFGPLNKQIIAGRFASTFSILMASGVSVIETIDILGQVLENDYVQKKLEEGREEIQKGQPIGITIQELDVFPLMLTQMITVGEETGVLDEIMIKTAEFYENEVEVAIEKLISMIEPILIISLAFVVLFIVLAIMLPLMSMIDTVMV